MKLYLPKYSFIILLNTIKSLKDNSICLNILYWIIEKEDINKYELYDSYKDVLLRNINSIVSNFKYKYNIIANLLLAITWKQPNYVNDVFNNLKDNLKAFIKESNKNYHLQYSIFYHK